MSLIAAACAAAAATASAAELGKLVVYSAAGEPLNAELTIRDVDAKADQVMVRLASAATYSRVGKEVRLNLSDLSLTLLKRNPYTVQIKGKQPVEVQSFPLIVELSDAGAISAKLYDVVLQKKTEAAVPAAGTAQTPAAQTAKTSEAPAAVGAVPSAANRVPAAQTPAVPAARTAAAAQKPATPAVRSAQPQPQTRAAARPAPRTSASGPVKLPLNPADYDLDQPFLVRDGMTMWSIATLYRPRYPQASMDQILVAFVRANPSAYEGGRVNGVRMGSRLHAPLASDVAAVGLDEAWALVRVAPNADARKAPSAKVLERAHRRMQKEAPAIWRKWKAQNPDVKPVRTAKTEPKKTVKEEPKAAAPVKEAEPPKTETPAEPPKPAVDPLAATIAQADAAHEAKITGQEPAQTEEKPDEKPAAAAPEQPAAAAEPAPAPEAPAPEPKAREEEEGGSIWGTLIGILVVLAAAAGGAWFWMKRRASGSRRREENLGVVKFRKAQAATDEQLQGTQQMLDRRLESEAATERMKASQSQPQGRIEPTFGTAAQASAQPSGFNVAAAYVGDDAADKTAAGTAANAGADHYAGKLITAQTYIGVGAYAEAENALREVIAGGTAEQRSRAMEMLARIQKDSSGGH